jgi:hypothetical protein
MNVEACNSPQEEQGTAQGEVLLDTRCPAASYGRLRPFSAAAIAQTYIHADQLSLVFERVAAAADRKLCALGEPAQQLWLKSLGSWSAFGLQLGPRTARPDLQGSGRAGELTAQLLARELYLSADPNFLLHAYIDEKAHEAAAGAPDGSPGLATLPGEEQMLLERLEADGFLAFSPSQLAGFGLDLAGLQAEAGVLVAPSAAGHRRRYLSVTNEGAVISARSEIPSLAPLFRPAVSGMGGLAAVVQGYLGQRTVLDGYKVTKLGAGLESADQYISAQWHHDRAGRRLKMFVYLHDVDCINGRPTQVRWALCDSAERTAELSRTAKKLRDTERCGRQVALGSHRLLYYFTDSFPSPLPDSRPGALVQGLDRSNYCWISV